jgi:hypothetical protein
MFKKLGKDIIACVGIHCDCFEKLKKMNVMIPEIHEKMWEEENRWGCKGVGYAKANDYKFIELLEDYFGLYIFKNDNYKKMYEKNIEEKINEYKGMENINIS